MTTDTAPPAPVTAPPAASPYTILRPSGALALLLPLLARGRGGLRLDARSLGGYGHQQLEISAGTTEVSPALPDLVADDWELRASIVSTRRDLVAAVVWWHPAWVVSAEKRCTVLPAESARIGAAIARAPAQPSLVIDGAHEVVALWWLDPVVSVTTDLETVCALLGRMASALDGDLVKDPWTLTIPLAGVLRNWTMASPDLIRVFARDPCPTFTLAALQTAFATEA